MSVVLSLGAPLCAQEPVAVKVFVASMFEIGENSGDRAGGFQHWYQRYWDGSDPIAVRGALNPVFCNSDGGLRRGARHGKGQLVRLDAGDPAQPGL